MGLQFVTIFKVRIVYNNGYFHDFECSKFSMTGSTMKWTATDNNNKPIDIARDLTQVTAVWQVGQRRTLQWVKK